MIDVKKWVTLLTDSRQLEYALKVEIHSRDITIESLVNRQKELFDALEEERLQVCHLLLDITELNAALKARRVNEQD